MDVPTPALEPWKQDELERASNELAKYAFRMDDYLRGCKSLKQLPDLHLLKRWVAVQTGCMLKICEALQEKRDDAAKQG